MKIRLATLYVDDQEKALQFYTNVPGFVKTADFSQGFSRDQRSSSTAPEA